MIRRNAFSFIALVLVANFAFGAYLLGQKRGGGSRSEYYGAVTHFGSVMEMVKDRYVDEDVDYEALTRSAINGMLRSLDPHSELLEAKKFEDLQSHTRQEYGGIGVQIERRDNRITVIAPIAGTPGEEAGIMPGDQIIMVDGDNTENLGLEEIVDLLRGKAGTEVTIAVHRPHTGDILEKTVRREVIQVESVRNVRMMDERIGYVQLTQFGQRTGAEFEAALDQLESDGMRGLVLDLRNNPGGLLSASVDVAKIFFDRNELIVYTQGRTARDREEIRAGRRNNKREFPIAVLINGGSASASEIVAGALQDTRRAVVVGETSFGKGSVQSILPLRDGDALRLTTAKYYTPGGRIIHERGVEPDIVVTVPLEDEALLRLQRNRPDVDDPEGFFARFGYYPISDTQLDAAVDALKGMFLFSEQRERQEELTLAEGVSDDSGN